MVECESQVTVHAKINAATTLMHASMESKTFSECPKKNMQHFPNSSVKESNNCSHLNDQPRKYFDLDASEVPSKNYLNSIVSSQKSRTFEMQSPSLRKTTYSLQKFQLKSLQLSKSKKRKVPKRTSFLETIFNCLANKRILQLLSQLRFKSNTLASHKALPTPTAKIRKKIRVIPGLGATSFFTLITLIFLEMVLLSTVSNCAKTFYMHWNTSNSIFRIDNTDHIIDVNKGNLAFEFDQVHIICPVYEPGTFENETEKYIIYNVSKVEYETCRITNADPRVIAICDKPQKLMFFTITFRPFTPQPGGLEFLPGNDYYFISTSSKDDLYRRIGGRCSTNNMKVVFKVCCAPEEKNKTTTLTTSATEVGSNGGVDADISIIDTHSPVNTNQQQQHNNINTFSVSSSGVMNSGININSANGHNNGIQLKPLNIGGSTGTSINTNIDQFNRIPMQTSGINVIGHNIGIGGTLGGNNGILLAPGGSHGGINMIPTAGGGNLGSYHPAIGQYQPGQTTTGIRINNVPSQQYPPHKHNNNRNNGKDAEEQELGGGGGGSSGFESNNGINIHNQLPSHLLHPIIDTNHSNIVQSTINLPPTHWSGNSNINYYHNTNQNIQNQNISANKNHYHSPPHIPPTTTSITNHNKKNKKDHYDKHPNEVVKNEELTYNSASAPTHRVSWSCRNNFAWNDFWAKMATIKCLEYVLGQESILSKLLQNPLVFLTILFVTLFQCSFVKLILNCNFTTSYLPSNENEKNEKQRQFDGFCKRFR